VRHDRSSMGFLFAENDIVEALQSSSESDFILSNMRCDKRYGTPISMYLFITKWFEIMSYACVSQYS
jgi:hypothetical protein